MKDFLSFPFSSLSFLQFSSFPPFSQYSPPLFPLTYQTLENEQLQSRLTTSEQESSQLSEELETVRFQYDLLVRHSDAELAQLRATQRRLQDELARTGAAHDAAATTDATARHTLVAERDALRAQVASLGGVLQAPPTEGLRSFSALQDSLEAAQRTVARLTAKADRLELELAYVIVI